MDRLTTFLAWILALTALITRGEGRGLEEHVESLGRLEAERSNRNSTFDDLEHDQNNLNNLVTDNEQQGNLAESSLTNYVRRQCPARVAFTVGMTLNRDPYYVHVLGIVKYNHVMYNVGPHGWPYSRATGKFTTPVAGLYSFSVSVLAGNVGSQGACVHLYVQSGGSTRSVSAAGANDPVYRAAASTSVVIHLRVGDTVYVATCNYPNLYMFGTGTPFNVFTGHLLSADNCL